MLLCCAFGVSLVHHTADDARDQEDGDEHADHQPPDRPPAPVSRDGTGRWTAMETACDDFRRRPAVIRNPVDDLRRTGIETGCGVAARARAGSPIRRRDVDHLGDRIAVVDRFAVVGPGCFPRSAGLSRHAIDPNA